jgi:PAS domain S-box-containing protein
LLERDRQARSCLQSNRLSLALRAGQSGVFEWRPDDRSIWWSPETYVVYGVDPQAFVPTMESIDELVHPDDREELWRRTEACVAHRQPFIHEYRIIRPDGTMRWIANRSHVSLNAKGEVDRLTGVALDVTDRRQAAEAMRQSEERLRLAAEVTGFGTYDFDPATSETTWSPELRAILGVGPEVTAKSFQYLELVHWEDRKRFRQVVRAALDPSGDGRHELEFRILRPDGRTRWVRDCGRSYFEGEGTSRRATRVIGTLQDITDRREAEQRLLEADRRKDAFMSVLAHELRNPLAPVRHGVELLRALAPPEPRLRRPLDVIDRQLTHMTRLIDDLLDVSRVSRGKLVLKKERCDVALIATQLVEDFRSIFDTAGLTLSVEAHFPAWVMGDPVRLVQMLGNLLQNASRFTERGGHAAVVVSVDDEARQAVLRVTDSGIGIDPQDLERLFDPFEQAEQSIAREKGGLGLGLALTRGLAQLHGGQVTAESRGLGAGASFTVRLPLAEG